MPEANVNASAERDGPAGALRRLATYCHYALLAVAIAAIVGGAQATLFYQELTPRIEEANRLLFDLVVEHSQEQLYEGAESRWTELSNSAGTRSVRLNEAWEDFHDQFATAPVQAVRILKEELEAFEPAPASGSNAARLRDDLNRLASIYTDHYEPLLEQLDDPPLYLWPTTHLIARYSGLHGALTANKALHLAQQGELGTARVMLAGLRASVEDPRILGRIYYLLGRLEFELFRARPEADVYAQSVLYLQQSLRVDPDSQLARRFLDYLLSLSLGEAATTPGEGEPTRRSEGEGAAISADKRRF